VTRLNWKLLTAFEAAARHRSFTRAADELNVQQPAISRRVAELEAELGIALLHRTRPHATLTQEGDVLFRAVAASAMQVSSALEQVRRRPDRRSFTVDTTIGFASCYLMKRLPGFQAANPDISVELRSRDQNAAFGREADVVVAFDRPDRLPGIGAQEIFRETLVAVARPDVAAAIGNDLAGLSQQSLLHLTQGIHSDDWHIFFAGTELVPRRPLAEHKFTSFIVYLQAALNGDGVALGWERLLQDHIDFGQLVPVTQRRVKTERGYFACLMERATANPSAEKFVKWLSGSASSAIGST